MKDLESLSASQAIKALSRREIKSSDLLLSCLDRIGQRESTVKAWVSLGKENALTRAKELDKGAIQGLLHGLRTDCGIQGKFVVTRKLIP